MVVQTVFQSDALRPVESFAALDSMWRTSRHPMRVVSRTPATFRATIRELDLGPVNLAHFATTAFQVQRTAHLIRQADPELIGLVMPLRGSLGLQQAERQTVLGPSQLSLYDSSRPFHLHLGGGKDGHGGHGDDADDVTTLMRLFVPRRALAVPVDRLDRLMARPLPADTGIGGLLGRLIQGIATDTLAYQAADALRIGAVAQDLLLAVLAHHLDAEDTAYEENSPQALLTRIDAFVQDNLPDPQLSPRAIAAALHISLSYLHRLFQPRGTTVSAWIRTQRLEKARRALGDPTLRTVPVHRIARQHGFGAHETFTRAFRATYGIAPTDYRRHTSAECG